MQSLEKELSDAQASHQKALKAASDAQAAFDATPTAATADRLAAANAEVGKANLFVERAERLIREDQVKQAASARQAKIEERNALFQELRSTSLDKTAQALAEELLPSFQLRFELELKITETIEALRLKAHRLHVLTRELEPNSHHEPPNHDSVTFLGAAVMRLASERLRQVVNVDAPVDHRGLRSDARIRALRAVIG